MWLLDFQDVSVNLVPSVFAKFKLADGEYPGTFCDAAHLAFLFANLFSGSKMVRGSLATDVTCFSLLLQFRFSLPQIGKDFFWHLPLDLVSPKHVKKESVGPSSERMANGWNYSARISLRCQIILYIRLPNFKTFVWLREFIRRTRNQTRKEIPFCYPSVAPLWFRWLRSFLFCQTQK